MSFLGTIQQALSRVAPYFIQNKNVGRFLQAVAVTLDASLEDLSQGMRLGHPLRCDPSALPVLARDRRMRLYDSEPIASQRYRLAHYLQLKRQFGTHQGQMRNIAPFFLSYDEIPIIKIVFQSGSGDSASWNTLNADNTLTRHKAVPSNWDYDGVTAQWSRYWAIVHVDRLGLAAQALWDGGDIWDAGGVVWDGLFTEAEYSDMIAGIREAQRLGTVLWGMIVTTDPDSFDPETTAVTDATGWTSLPTGNWAWAIDNTTGQPSRPPAAVFIRDLGPGIATP